MPGVSFHGIAAVFFDIDNMFIRSNWIVDGPGDSVCPYLSIYEGRDPAKALVLTKSPAYWLGQDPGLIKAHCNRIIAINRAKGLKTFFGCITSKGDYDDLVDIVAVELAAFLGKVHEKEVTEAEQRAAIEAFQAERCAGYQVFCVKDGTAANPDPKPYFDAINAHPLGGFFPGNFSHAATPSNLAGIIVPKVCIMKGVVRYKKTGSEERVDCNLYTWVTWARAYRKQMQSEGRGADLFNRTKAYLADLGLDEEALQTVVALSAMSNSALAPMNETWWRTSSAIELGKGDVMKSIVAVIATHYDLPVAQAYLLDDSAANCRSATENGYAAFQMPEVAFYQKRGGKKPDGTRYNETYAPTRSQQVACLESFWRGVLAGICRYQTGDTCYSTFLFGARAAARAYQVEHASRPVSSRMPFKRVQNLTRFRQAGFMLTVMDHNHDRVFTFDQRLALCKAVRATISAEAYTLGNSSFLRSLIKLIAEVERTRDELGVARIADERVCARQGLENCVQARVTEVPDSLVTSAARL